MFLSHIRQRRSIRRYTNKEIEAEKIEQIIEAILRSPSSKGHNPWEFVLVTDRDLLKKLAGSKVHGSSFIANASLAVVVCGDPAITDTWVEDTSIATVVGQFAAESLGLGSCWVQIRDRQHSPDTTAEVYLSEILNIPDSLRIESILVVGYPDEQKPSKELGQLQFDKVRLNSYNTPFNSASRE